MSKEYIEREQVIEQLTKMKDNFSPTVRPMFDVFKHIMLETSAADVAPVVHGEWIPIVSYFHGKPDGRYYCSVCHRVETMKGIYCRLCGARMDGGNKNVN